MDRAILRVRSLGHRIEVPIEIKPLLAVAIHPVRAADSRSWVCRDKAGGIQALVYDLTDPRGATPVGDWTLFRHRLVPKPRPPVKIRFTSVPPGNYRLAITRIGFQENDAYSEYLKMGAPPQLTRPQVEHLKALSSGAPSEQEEISIAPSGLWEREIPMRENEVVLLTLTPG